MTHRRSFSWSPASSTAPAIESLESRLLLVASPVAGAWTGGAFDAIGLFEGGVWQLDMDGDTFVGDDSPAFAYGLPGDLPLAGDWDGDGVASVGVFRAGTFYLDLDDDRLFTVAGDLILRFGLQGDIPVAGNWDGDPGDEIGIFRRGLWCLDVSANGAWGAGDVSFFFGLNGDIPVAGNWNPATTNDSVGVFRNGIWSIDRNENFAWNGTGAGFDQAFAFGTFDDRPFAGDFVGDNTDEVAVLQFTPAPVFFVRELNSFPVAFTTTAQATSGAQAASLATETERAALTLTNNDDDLRDDLFGLDDTLL